MGALSLGARAGLVLAILLVAFLVRRFARGQNHHGGLGGAISGPKQLWLGFTLFTWFLACPLLALDPSVPGALREVLGTFAALMWVRGVAEMVMLYRTRNWRPPYGIAHDLVCLAVVVAGLLEIDPLLATTPGPLVAWQRAFGWVIAVSLVVETYYAYAFFRLVEGRTTGEDGVWFATEEDPRFVRINRITATLNVPLVGFALAFVAAMLVGE
jgi:hypothetical protein